MANLAIVVEDEVTALIDYGEGASVIQERSYAYAMKSSIWLMDPRPNLTSMVDCVEKAFEHGGDHTP